MSSKEGAPSIGWMVAWVAMLFVACSPAVDAPIQTETGDPSLHGGVSPLHIRNVTDTINVRLFPILSAPVGEPYPVTKNYHDVYLSNDSNLQIFDGNTLVTETKKIEILSKVSRIKIDSGRIPLKSYRIVPSSPGTTLSWDISDNSSRVSLGFRGEFLLTPIYFEERGAYLWSIINVVDIEEYLFSVVPSEVPTFWHKTTLEVQAIAARTYAIRQMILARDKNQKWDVDPTTMYQSYRGMEKERASTTSAVQETGAQIMTYDGGVIEASFSSHSGGITCSASECFELEDTPYLQPKTDTIEMETRQIANVGSWQACTTPELIQYHLARYKFMNAKAPTFSAPSANGRSVLDVCNDKTFRSKVRTQLDQRLAVKNIFPLNNTRTGRAWELNGQLAGGEKINLLRKESNSNSNKPNVPSLRSVLLGRRSHLMKLDHITRDGVYVVQGHGFGHGVGMSQYGAQWRAEKYKHTVEQILKFYYSEIELIRLKFSGH